MPAYGIIGNPVAHSLSPVLHGMLYEMTGHDGNYARFNVELQDMGNVVLAMKTLNISGINITSPYKEEMVKYMDALSPEACETGAVNTAQIDANGLVTGYNTDIYGIAQSILYAGLEIKGKSFVICGTGGGGKAARYALLRYGADRVYMASRNPKKGITYDELLKLGNMYAIINCTSLGMASSINESPVTPDTFERFEAAVDMIYSPDKTRFLKDADKAGLKTLNGLPMLVFQGIRSFEIWTGLTAPPEAVSKIISRLTCILNEKRV